MKRTIARAVLVVLVPLVVGSSIGRENRLPGMWLDGAIPLGLAVLIGWAVRQLGDAGADYAANAHGVGAAARDASRTVIGADR